MIEEVCNITASKALIRKGKKIVPFNHFSVSTLRTKLVSGEVSIKEVRSWIDSTQKLLKTLDAEAQDRGELQRGLATLITVAGEFAATANKVKTDPNFVAMAAVG